MSKTVRSAAAPRRAAELEAASAKQKERDAVALRLALADRALALARGKARAAQRDAQPEPLAFVLKAVRLADVQPKPVQAALAQL